ncbi:unnamed protein product, partial [Didymodactylos carnosus]
MPVPQIQTRPNLTNTPYPNYPYGMPTYPPSSITQPSYPPSSMTQPSYPSSSITQPSYPYAQPYSAGSQSGQIPDNIYKESLISAVMDKVKYRLMDVMQQSKAEIDTLRNTEEELVNGQQRLDMLISDAQQQENNLGQYITQLRSKTVEMKDAVQKMSSSNQQQQSAQHNVKDDAIITPAPIYK